MRSEIQKSIQGKKDSCNSSFDPKHSQCVHECSLLLVP